MTSDGALLPHVAQGAFRRARKGDRHAELVRGRSDLRGEHEVVENGENHRFTLHLPGSCRKNDVRRRPASRDAVDHAAEKHMLIETQAVGPFFKNGFVVACEETRDAVLIDPGDEVASLLAFVERQKLHVRHVLLTHAHVDHVTGVAAAKRALGVPVSLAP